MATAGIGSAVVLNVMLWCALLISIPIRGANGLYAIAAVAGVVVMMVAVGIVVGLIHGQSRAERIVRWIAKKFRFDGDKATTAVRQVGTRVEDLLEDKQLLRRVISFAALAWVLDAAVVVGVPARLRRHAGPRRPVRRLRPRQRDRRSIPITPGGLGIVEWVYIPTLVGFGMSRAVGRARGRCVPHQPVLHADRRRRVLLRLAALRPVEDRPTRAPRPLPHARPRRRGRRRVAARVPHARLAQAGRAQDARRRRCPTGRSSRRRGRT